MMHLYVYILDNKNIGSISTSYHQAHSLRMNECLKQKEYDLELL